MVAILCIATFSLMFHYIMYWKVRSSLFISIVNFCLYRIGPFNFFSHDFGLMLSFLKKSLLKQVLCALIKRIFSNVINRCYIFQKICSSKSWFHNVRKRLLLSQLLSMNIDIQGPHKKKVFNSLTSSSKSEITTHVNLQFEGVLPEDGIDLLLNAQWYSL